ncbi:MAG: SAM-dependent methyltransferase [Deltaproteobacteria bacterium]|nr:SAM-dependent methyltransferase [Deltaproteobacteria bacterium]
MIKAKLPSSFRDPSGFLFFRNGSLYRQVNTIYKKNYDCLIDSGLYKALIDAELLIPHQEVNINYAISDKVYKIIKPELIPFISYPYEWCFSQLKNAALTTLKIQKTALNFGMSLKDCSAYNIQFKKSCPIFIDTLSFEKYNEGQLWVAYRQFCQHFLAPLALMSYKDIRLNQLLRIYIDGVPLDLTSSLLPNRSRFRFSILSHIHLHAKSQKYFSNKSVTVNSRKISRSSFIGIVNSLEAAVRKLKWQPKGTEWADYYQDTNYTSEALRHKKQIITEFLDVVKPKNVWDLGANTGIFSRIASNRGIQTISFDIDPAAVEKNYLDCLKKNEINILPLLLDLTNPSSCIGWENQERVSLLERGPSDTAFALALIHHLAISNNLPLSKISNFFKKNCNYLIIEFVPKSDTQVQRLLSGRKDIFPDYTQDSFENEFGQYFEIKNSMKIKDTDRILYLMQRRKV